MSYSVVANVTMSKAEEKTILVVDDEKDVRGALTTILKDEGFKVIEAEDGDAGLRLAFEHRPDLILLDIVMPKLDGFTVLARLRADEWGEEANVFLLTVLEDIESVSKAIEHGGLEYFVKTEWRLEDIVAKVKKKLDVE